MRIIAPIFFFFGGVDKEANSNFFAKDLTGPRYPKVTKRSKVSKMFLNVQGIQKVPKGPRYPKGT